MSGIVSIHNRLYTYYDLERDLHELAICYPDSTELTSLGQSGWRSDQPIWLRRHYRSGASAGITGKDRDTERGKTLERKCEGS